jgi:enoyl-CoA hydratase/carnithine racemase
VLHGLLTGRRYGGEAARAAGFVDAVATEDALLRTAVGLVRDLVGEAPATVAALKASSTKCLWPSSVLDTGSLWMASEIGRLSAARWPTFVP